MERTHTREFEIQLKILLEAINLKYDYDFRQYAPASMQRTVVHAMNRMACRTILELKNKVLGDVECFYDLLQSLTIPVSEMFRDHTYFLALREKVIPHLKTYPSIKVWVAGCSTGEEVYSLAILLKEEDLLERTTLYATDINSRNLEQAEKGLFDLAAINNCAQSYQKSGGKCRFTDYYTVIAGGAKFKNALKKNITFADHSLVTDGVFSEMHLISCRNVLIYFDRELQDKTLKLFFDSLFKKGFLGLGAQETIQFLKYAKYYDPFVKNDRIYQKK